MLKRGQKKAKPSDCLKARIKPNFVCGIAIHLSQKTSKLQEHKKFSSEIRINLAWYCTRALIFVEFLWFVKLHTLGEIAHFG